MGRREHTSRGGRTCSRLGGGVADARDLVFAGEGRRAGVTDGNDGAIGLICTPIDGSGYKAKRESSTRLF
jgi:hypothetical protein